MVWNGIEGGAVLLCSAGAPELPKARYRRSTPQIGGLIRPNLRNVSDHTESLFYYIDWIAIAGQLYRRQH